MSAVVLACEAKNHSFLLPDWGDAATPASQRGRSLDVGANATGTSSTNTQTSGPGVSGAGGDAVSSELSGATSEVAMSSGSGSGTHTVAADTTTGNSPTSDSPTSDSPTSDSPTSDSPTSDASAPISTSLVLDAGTPSSAPTDGGATFAETSTSEPSNELSGADAGLGSPDAEAEIVLDSSVLDAAVPLKVDASIDASPNDGTTDAGPDAW